MPIHNHLSAHEIRQQMDGDPHRPRYHFLPPSNWMNDPNGVIQWQGDYHLFYQYNPAAPVHHAIHWGHAVSQDLVHWTDLPIALAPTPGGPDNAGVFSGCAVNHDGVPTLIYTAVAEQDYTIQTQCLATSDDALLTWHKHPANPVLDEVPAEAHQTSDFRDPFVWREGDMWYAAIGSRIDGIGGTVFLYRSRDLVHWDYLNPLYTGDQSRYGIMWECPNFFKLGDHWVLIVSPQYASPQLIDRTMGYSLYFVGDYVDHRFTPFSEGVLDHGYLYAPLSLQDDQGRRLMWGWLREGRSDAQQIAAGWSGVQSFPRVLSLHNGQLHMEPAPELKQIRDTHHHFATNDLTANPIALPNVGLALDIELEFTGNRLVLDLVCSPDGRQQVRIIYDRTRQMLSLDRAASNVHADIEHYPSAAQHALMPGEGLTLRILLDGSVLEIIANRRTSLSSRIYPAQTEELGLRITGHGAVTTLDVWEMLSIWH